MVSERGFTRVFPVDQTSGRGAKIRARRERIGWSARRLADRADMGRDTLARAEDDDPNVRPDTFARLERALDELAEELGFDEAEQSGRLVRYEVQSPGAVAVTVSGPVEDLAELEASVARIMAAMHAQAQAQIQPNDQDPSETET